MKYDLIIYDLDLEDLQTIKDAIEGRGSLYSNDCLPLVLKGKEFTETPSTTNED